MLPEFDEFLEDPEANATAILEQETDAAVAKYAEFRRIARDEPEEWQEFTAEVRDQELNGNVALLVRSINRGEVVEPVANVAAREHRLENPAGCGLALLGFCRLGCPDLSEQHPYYCSTCEFPGLQNAPRYSSQYFELNNRGTPTKFKPAILGQWLDNQFTFHVGDDNELYRYDASVGVYRKSDHWVKSAVAFNHGENYTGRLDNNVLDWLYSIKGSIGQRYDFAAPLGDGLINLANGVWKPGCNGSLMEHSPVFKTSIQIPVSYVPDALCPVIDKFISDSVPPEYVELVWQIIGYCLSGTNKYQKAILLYGPGGNGKTRLLDVIRALLGALNFSGMSLHQIADNRFMPANLHGKLANVCGDIGKDKVEHAEIIKNIVGQDPFEVERKHKQAYMLKPYAVLVFSGNSFPKVQDATPAFFDRFIIVEMPTVFRGTGLEDPDLEWKLVTRSELEGALVKGLAALERLCGANRFVLPNRALELRAQWRKDSDSRIAFVAECLTFTGEPVKLSTIYGKYETWCKANGVMAHAARGLNDAIKSCGGSVKTVDGYDYWTAITCKDFGPTFFGISMDGM